MAKYMKERRIKRRAILVEMSGGQCEECGSIDSLEFNHIDRSKKLFGLSGKGLDTAWNKILLEWEKCELLCSFHHQIKTKEQYSTGEIAAWRSMKHLPYEHGTMRMYNEKKCRCEACKYAKRLYRNKQIGFISDPVIPR